jgi:DNA-binding response OmpR family regulator
VNNLRKKVDRAGAGKLIHTVKGLGYVLEERPDADAGDVL